ncbi:helix-turn-helix transcriptional regulator [Myceligenerans xiligouense]|uniref:helix-turn-helix transcriptional regulator n=1 Tax=Myceligenerans xiligouense TaxID=253184 RepID=UPI001477613E|nr:helix-turn-helix transcriptional regulator [Myceligenerans xiligouense]
MTPDPATNHLGAFLRSRREHLRPVNDSGRRRTAGLRRAEVAARASISVEWYTRLEQGRGGRPSRQVLDAICTALELREDERTHAFVLAFGTTATADPFNGGEQLARTQRVLDNLMPWPAYLKSPTWDILAWNAASRRFLTDYPSIPQTDRNVLRILFTDPTTRERIADWHAEAKLTVATFRLEQARWNASPASVDDLVRALRDESAEFAAIWDLNEVGHLGQGIKHLLVGPEKETVSLHYESMTVDALPGAGLVVYAPVGPRDEHLLDRAMREQP